MGTQLHSLCLEEPCVPLTLQSRGKAVICRNLGLLYPCPSTCSSQYFLISSLPIPSLLSHLSPAPQLYNLLKLQGNHFVTVLLYILLPWETGGHIPRNECLHLFCHGQGWADDSQALVRLCHVAVCPKSPSSIQLEPSAPFRAEGSLDSLYWFIQLEKDIHKMDTPREFWKKLVYSILLCRMK